MNITIEKIAATAGALCEAPGPSGRECAAFAAARELLAPLGEVTRTPLGSLLCCVNPGREGAPLLLLEQSPHFPVGQSCAGLAAV